MTAATFLKFIKEKEADFVDLRFTDPRGKLQHNNGLYSRR